MIYLFGRDRVTKEKITNVREKYETKNKYDHSRD